MTDVQEVQGTSFRIPLLIRIGLIGIHVVIAALAFVGGFGVEQLTAFGMYIITNVGLLPLVFVAIGLVGKLVDRSFRLENAYYLGLLMSLVLAVQKV
jgi:hypothetical protein